MDAIYIDITLNPRGLLIVGGIFNSAKEEDLISIIEGTSIFYFWEQMIGHTCTLQKTPFYSCLATGIASSGLNGVYDIRFDTFDQNTLEKIIREIISHFAHQNLPFSLISGDHQAGPLNLERLLLNNSFTCVFHFKKGK